MNRILVFVIALLAFWGCGSDDSSSNDQAVVQDVPVVVNPDKMKALESMPDAQIFQIDTSKSRITWHCENHKGLVDLKDGRIFVRKDDLVGAYAEAITKTARDTSITYKLMKGTFNNVLQTADFFDGAHYPLLKFTASNIQKDGAQYKVDGELSVRNVIKPIQFNLTSFRKKDGQISFETEDIPVNRTLFGMELNSRSFPDKAKDFIFSDTFFVKMVVFARAE